MEFDVVEEGVVALARKFHQTSVCGLSSLIFPAFSLETQLDRVSTQPNRVSGVGLGKIKDSCASPTRMVKYPG